MNETMLHLDSLEGYLIHITWKTTGLLLLAHGFDRFILRRRPLVADLMWRSVVLILVGMPIWCLFLPRFALPLVNSPVAALVAYGPIIDDNGPLRLTEPANAALSTGAVTSGGGEASVASRDEIGNEGRNPIVVVPAVVLAYGLIAGLLALRLGLSLFAVKNMLSESMPVTSGSWKVQLAAWKLHLCIKRPVELKHSHKSSVPIAVGWLRPTIILPSSECEASTRYAVNAVLLHELTHIARNDYPVHMMSKVAGCIFWYNPLVWLAVRRLGQVRETICDGYCISRLNDREGYVGVLLHFAAELSRRLPAPLGLAMARTNRLERRLSDLVTLIVPKYSLNRRARVAAGVFALGMSGVISMAAVGDETSNRPPTVDEIVTVLRAKEETLETLQTSCICLEKFNFVKPGTKPPPEHLIEDDAVSMTLKAEISWEAARDGRGRMEAAIQRTSVRPDDTEVAKDERIVSTFNGTAGRWLEQRKTADGVDGPGIGRATQTFQRTHTSPFDMTTQHLGTPVSQLLVERRARVFGIEQWEDRPVVVVELLPVTVRQDYIYQQRIWIDVDRGTSVRRQSFVQRGEGMPWGLHYQVDAKKFSEASPGLWLPKIVDISNYHVTPAGQDFLVANEHYEVTKWMANKKIDSSRFDLVYPEGTLDMEHPRPGQPVPVKAGNPVD